MAGQGIDVRNRLGTIQVSAALPALGFLFELFELLFGRLTGLAVFLLQLG